MIKVTNEVLICEENDTKSIFINSYTDNPEKIILSLDGKNYTIFANDLIMAIKNAINTATPLSPFPKFPDTVFVAEGGRGSCTGPLDLNKKLS